jgi:hypothetical protein
MNYKKLPIDPEIYNYIANLNDYLQDMIELNNYQAAKDTIIEIRETIKVLM